MGMPPLDPAAVEALELAVAGLPGTTTKRMFGGLAAMVDGHVFALVIGGGIGVKLVGPALRAEALATPGAGELSVVDRRFTTYVALPAGRLEPWLTRAFEATAAQG